MTTLKQFTQRCQRAMEAYKKGKYSFTLIDLDAIREKCFQEVIADEIAKDRRAHMKDEVKG